MSDFFKNLAERTRFFNRNTMPKIVSIIFALMMWLYVMGEVNPEMAITMNSINVQLMNVEDLNKAGLVIMGQQDYTVSVRISGRRNDVYRVLPQDIIVRADLRGFHKGSNSIPLEYSAPSYIEVLDIAPKQLKITLDEVVARQKPVQVNTIGSASVGFQPSDAVATPREVMVEGPESLVNAVARVVAEVPIDGLSSEVNERFPIKAVNDEGRVVSGVTVREGYVDVHLSILPTKEVPIVLEFQGNPKDNFKVTAVKANPERVVIRGTQEKLNSITEIKGKPIDIAGIDRSQEKNITLLLPEGITTPTITANPRVAITVEKIESREFTFLKNEISIENIEEGYQLEFIKAPDNIQIRVDAIESILNNIQRNDIHLYINASNLLEGKYSTDIGISIPHSVERITLNPPRLDFEIKRDRESHPASGGQSDNHPESDNP